MLLVFCQPNIGTGSNRGRGDRRVWAGFDIYESDFKPMKHTLSGRDERTFEMIVRRSDDVVLGIHMVGPEAGEIIQGLQLL